MNISININIEKPHNKSEDIIVVQGSPGRDRAGYVPDPEEIPGTSRGPGSKITTRSPGISRRNPEELGTYVPDPEEIPGTFWGPGSKMNRPPKTQYPGPSNPAQLSPSRARVNSDLPTKSGNFLDSHSSINSSASVFQKCCVLLRKCHPTKKSQRISSNLGPKEIEPGVFTIMQGSLITNLAIMDSQNYEHIFCLNCHLIEMGSALSYFDDTCPQCGRNVKENTGGFY